MFFKTGTKFIDIIKKRIVKKAIRADITKSLFIPVFKSKPITLKGIPYLTRIKDIPSEKRGFICPTKKPMIRNGKMFINSLLIVLS